jgi:hypothetical protein
MNVSYDSPAGLLNQATRHYRRTAAGLRWGLDVDMRALRQMVREAISSLRGRRSGLLPDEESGEQRALFRCIAYAIGATNHVGYDRPANNAWRKACEDVRTALAVDTAPYSNVGVPDEDIDAVLDALLPVHLAIAEARAQAILPPFGERP